MKICEEFLEHFSEQRKAQWVEKFTQTFASFEETTYANSYDPGNFEECIKIKSDDYQGKYCMVQYYSTLTNITFVPPFITFNNHDLKYIDRRFGGAICIPSVCSENDFILRLMKEVFNGKNLIYADDYEQENFCQVSNEFSINLSGGIGILIILTLFIMTILTSCLFSQKSILKSFSLVRNLGSFFKVREDESMSYLRGIKTISYLSVIFLHVLLFSYYYPSNNSQKVHEFRNGLAKNTMVSSFSGLSVCYTIGSLLATKAIIKLIKIGKLNIPLVYFYRIISVIPSLLFILFIEKYIIHNWLANFINAPYFYPSQMEKICSNLWMPLTFLHNYIHTLTEGCIPPLYYLAVDLQLFMLTPLIIYVIFKWKKLDKIIFSALIIASIAINYSYVNNNLNYFTTFEFYEFENLIYSTFFQQTHYLLPAWIVGMIFGYYTEIYEILDLPKKKTQFVCCTIMMAFLINTFSFMKFPATRKFIAYFLAIDRFAASISFTLILFLCHYGYANNLRRILSMKFFIIFEKLGLCIFIAHALVLKWQFYTLKTPVTWSFEFMMYNFGVALTLTLIAAFIINFLVTQPFNNVFKFLFGVKS